MLAAFVLAEIARRPEVVALKEEFLGMLLVSVEGFPVRLVESTTSDSHFYMKMAQWWGHNMSLCMDIERVSLIIFYVTRLQRLGTITEGQGLNENNEDTLVEKHEYV